MKASYYSVFERQIHQVIERYREQPHEILIAQSIIYTSKDSTELGLQRAVAAAMGYSRACLYLDAARSLLRQILADATEISWRKEAYDYFLPILQSSYNFDHMLPKKLRADLEALVSLIEGAKYLTRDAELLWHLYVTYLDRSRAYMIHSVRKVRPDFNSLDDEKQYLDILRAFRNHLEHRENALDSLTGPDWTSFTESDREIITLGYRKNARNEVLFYSNHGVLKGEFLLFPLNWDGFETHQKMIVRIHNLLESESLENLRNHFMGNPEELPDIEAVGNLVSDSLTPTE